MNNNSCFAKSTLLSWNSFGKKITEICGEGDFRGKFLFRGQRDSNWELQSSFDRSHGGDLVERERAFEHAFSLFEKALHFGDYPQRSKEDKIGLAQHFGLPTRTLDWSYSPYVALFFACSGSLENSLDKRPALFALNVEKLSKFVSTDEVSTISYSPRENIRLRNQKGCFTQLKGAYSSLDQFCSTKADKTIISKLTISKSVVRNVLFHLSSMDITYERLFPGYEGMAKQAWLDYLLDN